MTKTSLKFIVKKAKRNNSNTKTVIILFPPPPPNSLKLMFIKFPFQISFLHNRVEKKEKKQDHLSMKQCSYFSSSNSNIPTFNFKCCVLDKFSTIFCFVSPFLLHLTMNEQNKIEREKQKKSSARSARKKQQNKKKKETTKTTSIENCDLTRGNNRKRGREKV